MKQNSVHRHIRCGRYVYSVVYRDGLWGCGGGWEPTPELAVQGYVKFLKSLRIKNSMFPGYMLKNLAKKTVRELHEAETLRQKKEVIKK